MLAEQFTSEMEKAGGFNWTEIEVKESGKICGHTILKLQPPFAERVREPYQPASDVKMMGSDESGPRVTEMAESFQNQCDLIDQTGGTDAEFQHQIIAARLILVGFLIQRNKFILNHVAKQPSSIHCPTFSEIIITQNGPKKELGKLVCHYIYLCFEI